MAAKTPARGYVTAALALRGLHPNRLSRSAKTGRWTARWSYYYRHGRDSESFAERVGEVLGANVVDHGDRWAPWPRDSYWWVEFEFTTVED
jgi:hypothetical protein